MQRYIKPTMQILLLESEDIITLSVNNEADEIIEVGGGKVNPWATSAQ